MYVCICMYEIKASEGKDAISSRYWLDLTGNKRAVMIYCDMTNEGRFLIIFHG